MALGLPPKAIMRCDAATARSVHDALTSVIAGHPQATTTYRFYEELDAWLGPWGQEGYPIAYGKFYNVAFTGNEKLMANPGARDWVWKTTILLQEALRDYVVGRVEDGTLPALTEPELRNAAFDSHPAAYDLGGLAMLSLTAPELVPVIATIPGREFVPTSENFGPTVVQVFATLDRVMPKMAGASLAALAGPAHTGVLARAARLDQQRMSDDIWLSRELTSIKSALDRGELDTVPALDRIVSKLNARQFPDQGFAQWAREVIRVAQARRQRLVQKSNSILQQSPAVRSRAERAFPYLLQPRGD